MKKDVVKTAIAAVCVVAAGMGGMKAYNAASQSEANVLLSENVEALSAGDAMPGGECPYWGGCCYDSWGAGCYHPSGFGHHR